jgi:hypothetical protein
LLHETANSLEIYNIKIEDILKYNAIDIQNVLLNIKSINYSPSNPKMFKVFNNIKNNFNIHADNTSIISFLVSKNKNLKKNQKKMY